MGLRTFLKSLQQKRSLTKKVQAALGDDYFQVVNMWDGHAKDNWLYQFIEHYQLNPKQKTILLYSVFGRRNLTQLKGNFIKIFFSGENVQNGFDGYKIYQDYCLNEMDLSMGFDIIDHQRYYRFPLWIMYCFKPSSSFSDVQDFVRQINDVRFRYIQNPVTQQLEQKNAQNSRFAILIASHDKLSNNRARLVDLLKMIQSVSCAGKFLNNTDELKTQFNDDKQLYLHQFRYNICPENCNHRDYTTEKIFDAIRAGCIPIYWGSDNNPEPEILNHDAILFYNPNNPNALLEEVHRLETDPDYYAEFIARPPFKEDAAEKIWAIIEGLKDRLEQVINHQ